MRNGMTFNGISEYVNIGAPAIPLNSFSLEYWIMPTQPESSTGHQMIWSCTGTASNYLSLYSSNRPFLSLSIGGQKLVDSGISLPLGKIGHVLGTFDGSNIRLYVNGTLAKTVAANGSVLNPGTMWTGNYATSPSGYAFPGSIYAARLYNRALSWQEVAANYQFGMATNRAGLVGEWLTDGTATDTSGNGNNGTIYGARPLVGQASNVRKAQSILPASNVLKTQSVLAIQ